VGTTGLTGNSGYVPETGQFLLDGAGGDIWGATDGCRFVSQPWSGDLWLQARVTKIDDTNYWAKAGVMVREALTGGAKHAGLFATGGFNPYVGMIRRETTGGTSYDDADFTGHQPPLHLRLVRSGNTFTTFLSEDALAWTQVGQRTFTMNAATYAGLAITAANTSALNKAEFDSVRLLGLPPAPWVSADIGAAGYAGMSGYYPATQKFEIDASGAEICCSADEFRYVHQPIVGDIRITARVVALENTGARAKAGLMIREDLTPGSRHFAVELHGSGTLGTNRRLGTDGGSGEDYAAGSFTPPYWIRLERTGGNYRCYHSANGTAWTEFGGPYPEAFGANAYAGLTVCANTNADLATAQFDNVTVAEFSVPTAAIQSAPDITVSGATTHSFTITYADNVAVKVSTLDNSDIRVTGPNSYSQLATFLSVDTAGDGTPRTATYRIPAPGGTWDTADNGAYGITVRASQVSDTSTNYVVSSQIGTFDVNISAPDTTAPAASASASDVTLAGGANHTFTVTYTDNAAVKVSTLDGSDLRVTGPNGFNQLATFLSVDTPGDGTPRTATYRITAPGGAWDFADNGAYTLSVQASQVTDTSSNPVAAGAVGTFAATMPDPNNSAQRPWTVYR
jgi:hypothetical protein